MKSLRSWKIPEEDRAGREDSRIAIGQTSAGRFLQVIYVLDRDSGGIFAITAYELSPTALAACRQQMRQRQRG